MEDAAIAGRVRALQEKTGTRRDESRGRAGADGPMTRGAVRVTLAGAILAVLTTATAGSCWGPTGHGIVARAALAACAGLPGWFLGAEDAVADLANGPDRWREVERTVPALGARGADHFFDLDVWGGEALPADRWSYVARAESRRLRPEAVGF